MPDLIGKTLGPYRIVEQIGLGGMATVYKAYQPSMDRYVALKVLSTHLAQDTTFVKRFQQEAKVIAKLEHLHILPVYDHGEEGGYLYLVMRFIEAGTLKDRLAKGPLSLDEARRVVTQVGSALEYAHQLGVIHRDIKPSNVLITPQGDCYLTDFGIAKMVEGTLGLTGSGVIGTPHYMAPEQSQSLKVDHRADVYAMGVVIYEMVTGQVPFDAETPFAVVMKHVTEPLPLPHNLRPDLPEAVERVILRTLAKDPADRYQSMRDLVTGFDQAVSGAPAEARAEVTPPRVAQLPTLVEEGEAEPTAVVPGPATASIPAWRRWAAGQPPWLLPAAGLALIVLVLAGLIVSQIPGRVEISGGQVQVVLPTTPAAPTAAASPASMATATSTSVPVSSPSAATQTPRPSLTPQPTATLTPAPAVADRCRIVYERERDLYVSNCDGSDERRLTDHPAWDMFPAWSPDGQRIVFNSERDRQPLPDGSIHDSLYVMSADGSGLTRLTFGDYNDLAPVWAPDGGRIAFHRNCSLMTIASDGSNPVSILPGSDELCPDSPAWSPDGQRLAFVSWDRPEPQYYAVYVINATGTGLLKLTRLEAKFAVPVWSPDGQQIGVQVDDAAGVRKYFRLNADASGQPVEVQSIPDSWFSWYWPQWGGEARAAAPGPMAEQARVFAEPTLAAAKDYPPVPTPQPTATPNPMPAQARAFAEPILAAIKDRPPDFADDFSTADKGWNAEFGSHGEDGTFAIEDGVIRFRMGKSGAYFSHEALNHKNMVLQVDASQAAPSTDSHLQVVFHNKSQDYWYNVDLNLEMSVWVVRKMWLGQQHDLAGGTGIKSPIGRAAHITIVVRGPQAAIYLDNTPAAYLEDADLDGDGLTLLGCDSDTQAVCEFDNLKFWNLDNVPGLPPAQAAPAAASQPPAQQHADQARTYMAQSRWDEALAEISQAIELDPGNPQYYITRALVHDMGKGMMDQAVADASQAVELAPTLYDGWIERSAVYDHMGKCDLSAGDASQAIQLDPQRLEGYVSRADALSCAGQLDEAIADYNRALEISGNSSWAFWTRGMTYERKGDLRAAISDYSQAITNGADDKQNQPDWLLSRAGAYRAQGEYEWALRDCTSILWLVPNDPRGFYCRGMSEAALGQTDQARADFKQAVSLTPTNAWSAWVTEAAQTELNKIEP